MLLFERCKHKNLSYKNCPYKFCYCLKMDHINFFKYKLCNCINFVSINFVTHKNWPYKKWPYEKCNWSYVIIATATTFVTDVLHSIICYHCHRHPISSLKKCHIIIATVIKFVTEVLLILKHDKVFTFVVIIYYIARYKTCYKK